MMSEQQFERFIINLKLLNAKERDHLMRYAYLGATGTNDKTESYLSDEFTENLKPHLIELGLSENSKCLFAGMDYHLDWLYVALKFAIDKPDFKIRKASKVDIFEMEAAPPGDTLYCDFRPLMGNQEDIDLIAVFKDEPGKDESGSEAKYAIFFIEAKGCAAFNRVQLARKLIRLDHILKLSGVVIKDSAPLINYRLILAAPEAEKPTFTNCRVFAHDLPKSVGPDKFVLIREALKDSPEAHLSKIGEGMHYMKIPNFPKSNWAIKRIRDVDSGHFTQWGFDKRKSKDNQNEDT